MEENKNNQQQQNQFQMGISPEVAEGTYSNLALITHSSSDFILDFACALQECQHLRSRAVSSWHLSMPSVCSRHCRAMFITTSRLSVRLSWQTSQSVLSLHLAHQKVRLNA